MPGSSEVCFATSNGHKYVEARFILRGSGLRLHRLPSKGTEIQSDDISEIARSAASNAFRKHNRPLFVEDTMLSVAALHGFPGTYGAYVYRTIGPDGILQLLRGVGDRSAEFASAVAFSDTAGEPIVFVGRLRGRIAEKPKGSGGFGFDSVFIPNGETLTLAEMTLAEKCAISHRSKAIRAFVLWYRVKRGGQRL